jgi:hypothetical protein
MSELKAHLKYASYIARHKWFVFQAGLRTGASLWRLLKHDWSKFLPSEWIPYAMYFNADGSETAFNEAWLLHQHRNDHHWQYWVLRNDDGSVECLQMPEKVWREMLADWMGAGRAITGRWECAEWYAKNRDKIQLHPNTRAFIEAKLEATR